MCGACIDDLFSASVGNLGGEIDCNVNYNDCVRALAGPFINGGGNVRALSSCDQNAAKARLQAKCKAAASG